jgi:hypothetical protein
VFGSYSFQWSESEKNHGCESHMDKQLGSLWVLEV